MKAAVYRGSSDIKIEDVTNPVPGPGEVLLRPRYCGVDNPELATWRYGGKVKPGTIIGHEFSAEVVATGKGVDEWSPSDKVVAASIISCCKCAFCKKGKNHLCEDIQAVGFTVNGGLSEQVTLPARALYPVPENLGLKEAALAGSLANTLHGFSKVNFKPGETALVIGAGIHGLLAVQVARVSGASSITVADPYSTCRKLAGRLGAMHLIDSVHSSLQEELERKTGSSTADLVVVAAVDAASAAQAFPLTRTGGNVLVLTAPDTAVQADYGIGIHKELTIHFSYRSCFEIPSALKLISKGIIDTNDIVTKEVRLDEINEKGLFHFFSDQTGCAKILVEI